MKKTCSLRSLVLALLLIVPFAKADLAHASSVTLSDMGMDLTLDLTGNHVTLTIKTAGFSGSPSVDRITAVNWKITNDINPSLVTLTNSPGPDAWTLSEENISSNGGGGLGCAGGGEGFLCTETTGSGALLGGNLVWEWDIPGGLNLFNNLQGAHIGAKLNDATLDLAGKIISLEAPIPEPGSSVLFAAGFLVVGLSLRSSRRAR
jgi:hypothetical protein